jgi:hypothetical protein
MQVAASPGAGPAGNCACQGLECRAFLAVFEVAGRPRDSHLLAAARRHCYARLQSIRAHRGKMTAMRSILLTAAAGIALAGGSIALGPAFAQPAIEVGVLNCSVSGGTGFVFGSSKALQCVFQSGPNRESYFGTINKFGIDIGATSTGVIAWAVFAPTQAKLGPGSLAGNYGGVTGEATVGIGVGANALIGGSNRTIALQPLSVGAQQGLNLAVGIAALELKPSY